MKAFYPTTLLVTGFDIIFFWAARMIMFGIEMTGQLPFSQVHIHGLVRDAERQKMSKTKGNVIDPLVINEKYGTDAVRFGLLVAAAPGNDIALSEEVLERGRNFANKIWNASRLLFSRSTNGKGQPVSVYDRWIQTRLNLCSGNVNQAFKEHRYHEAANALYHFWWDDFCDWYLEFKKLEDDWSFAYIVYEKGLRLLHPLMPFITEELWQHLGLPGKTIALEQYPQRSEAELDIETPHIVDSVQQIIVEARRQRADAKVDSKELINGILFSTGETFDDIQWAEGAIEKLAKVKLELRHEVYPGVQGDYLKLELPVDRVRLGKENEQLEKVIASSRRQLDSDFATKAPANVVANMRSKLAEYEAQLAKNHAALGE